MDLSKAGGLNVGKLGFQAFKSLRKIVAPNGTFSSIETDWFGEHNSVEHVNFSWNWFRELKRKFFVRLRNLRVLDMSGCDIYTIEVNTFVDNPNLDSLDVSNNWLDRLVDMGHMPRLRNYDGSNNEIIDVSLSIKSQYVNPFVTLTVILFQVPHSIFSNQPALENISLAINSIQRIRDRSFTGLSNLRNLNLSTNSLSEINVFAYDHETLQMLDFSTNDIDQVKANTFVNLRNLRSLDVSNNSIRRLDVESFRGLDSLRALALELNSLADLPPGVFSPMPQLDHLNLSHNALQSFDGNVFGSADIPLRALDLNSNSLYVIQPQSFLHTPNLEYLSLAHNMLKELDVNLLANVHLRTLHFQYNLVEELPTSFYNDLTSVKELLMNHNRLTFLPDGRELLNMERMTVEGNPWQCPCFNDLFAFITSRHIDYRLNGNDYYDGSKPLCIVTPADNCVKDIQLVKTYRVVEIYEGL